MATVTQTIDVHLSAADLAEEVANLSAYDLADFLNTLGTKALKFGHGEIKWGELDSVAESGWLDSEGLALLEYPQELGLELNTTTAFLNTLGTKGGLVDMIRKDFEGEAEWWHGDHIYPTRNACYLRLECEDTWTWYQFDSMTNNLIELNEDMTTKLEEMRDGY